MLSTITWCKVKINRHTYYATTKVKIGNYNKAYIKIYNCFLLWLCDLLLVYCSEYRMLNKLLARVCHLCQIHDQFKKEDYLSLVTTRQ